MLPTQEQIAHFMTHGCLQDNSCTTHSTIDQALIDQKKFQNELIYGAESANDPTRFDEKGNLR